ncbi:hypothetical protein COTS27_01649 [Spirochaetota bacterium]|nr:hypothetical protein COTS27_01649 [Spirochaetota bacterium]
MATEKNCTIEAVSIKTHQRVSLINFLESHDYIVTHIKGSVYRISREQLEVFLNIDEHNLFFEVEVGSVNSLKSENFYKNLLDLNTEILPVSLALDTVSTKEPRLIIVESRERKNLDENEVLSVLEAMEIAITKVEILVSQMLS